MTAPTSFGILDQSPIRRGMSGAEAAAETLALAQAAEGLGYDRYWVAEHHNTQSFAGSCPEILMTRIASATKRLRVGSAGVLLHHYAPLKIAEQFRMMEALFPGRIDLGLGRAPGGDPRTAAALQNGPQAFSLDTYPHKVELLIRLLDDGAGIDGAIGLDHPYHGIRAMPDGPGVPQIWILGSGQTSAIIAARFGQHFAYAHFIAGDDGDGTAHGAEIVTGYRNRFLDSTQLSAPHAACAVSVICAPTDDEAQHIAASRERWVLGLLKGRHEPFLPPEEAAATPYTDKDKIMLEGVRARAVVGSPATVKARLDDIIARYGVSFLAIHTFTYGFEERLRSYELVAEAMGLSR